MQGLNHRHPVQIELLVLFEYQLNKNVNENLLNSKVYSGAYVILNKRSPHPDVKHGNLYIQNGFLMSREKPRTL